MRQIGSNGWSLNEFLMGIGIMAFALVFATVLFDVNIKPTLNNKEINNLVQEQADYTYKDMEAELVKAASTYMYISSKYKDLSANGDVKITIKELKGQGLYSHVLDPKDSHTVCKGYVIFSKSKESFSYKPYIKCGNHYQTKGYS